MMNSAPILFFGIFATLVSSFWALVLVPQLQIGSQDVRTIESTGLVYPPARSGSAQAGAEVYRANGCVECHSQQVRANGPDLARGWGKRVSVHQDYLRDYPVLLGNARIGPDLANMGSRQLDPQWHLRHLYNARSVVPGSLMPQYPFLFNKRPLAAGAKLADDALPADTEPGFEITPRQTARDLTAYLMSLQSETGLFEAPLPLPPPTNAPPADVAPTTNAPAPAASAK